MILITAIPDDAENRVSEKNWRQGQLLGDAGLSEASTFYEWRHGNSNKLDSPALEDKVQVFLAHSLEADNRIAAKYQEVTKVQATLGSKSVKFNGLALDDMGDLGLVESNGSKEVDLGERCEVEFDDEVEDNQTNRKKKSASFSTRGDGKDVRVANLKENTMTSELTKSSKLTNTRDIPYVHHIRCLLNFLLHSHAAKRELMFGDQTSRGILNTNHWNGRSRKS
ncbi:uncharacterized protein EAF01_010855 [Botrytis porri]|uniref:uncharacterized protein n=1 Tax=Botrytis porri TaxID=87229 RepID=UPI0018FF7F24|nr:uncharacterized protein EAF01_010855 [Botrytis porri]KAF7889362.1 hypothetical protein EAF01_010855 [Botrytis porri]